MRRPLALLAALAAAGTIAALAGAASTPPYRVAAIKPYLFFSDTGTFSKEVPTKEGLLWNTIIGEGWARHPSDATLVKVVVAGRKGSYESGRAVRLVVRKGKTTASGTVWGKPAVVGTQRLGVVNNTGTTVTGFWLYGTGCIPLRVAATITGQAHARPVERVIPFGCGE